MKLFALQNNDLFIHFLTFLPGSGSGSETLQKTICPPVCNYSRVGYQSAIKTLVRSHCFLVLFRFLRRNHNPCFDTIKKDNPTFAKYAARLTDLFDQSVADFHVSDPTNSCSLPTLSRRARRRTSASATPSLPRMQGEIKRCHLLICLHLFKRFK